jgi:hypothetical protein
MPPLFVDNAAGAYGPIMATEPSSLLLPNVSTRVLSNSTITITIVALDYFHGNVSSAVGGVSSPLSGH